MLPAPHPGQSVSDALEWALFKRSPTSAIGQFGLCLIATISVFNCLASSPLLWLGVAAIIGTNVVRLRLAKRSLAGVTVPRRWLKLHRATIVASALAWAFVSVLVFEEHGTHHPHSVNLLLLLCGLMAAGSASLAPSLQTFRAFSAILCLPPFYFSLAARGEDFGTTLLSAIAVAYFAFMLKQASTLHEQLADLFGKERELHEAETKFRSVAENIPGMVFQLRWTETTLDFAFVSASAEAFLGFTPAEFMTKLHPEDRRGFEHSLAESASALKAWGWEGRVWEKSGWRWLHGASTPRLERDDSVRFSGLFLDVTALKEAEFLVERERARAMSSARMASLGEMASGVAHEINNPLAILSAKAQLLSTLAASERLDNERVARTASSLVETCDRIARIVRGLRTFAREGSEDPFSEASVTNIVQETLDLCHARFLSHGVELRVLPFSAELSLDCRKTQIEQVLINLLNNAFDAVEKTDNPWVELAIVDAGERIVFRVTDSGRGIPDTVAQKLAQPFFTTKEVGRGTGLGLSISSGIIRQHGGKLTLDRACLNTRFEVELPRRHPAALSQAA